MKRLLAAVLLLGALLRLNAIGVPRLNVDEGWSYYLCQNPFAQVVDELQRDRHPPMGYAGLRLALLAGLNDELLLRLPLLLTSSLAVGLVFLVGRELFSERVGLGAAALYAVSYPAWEYDTWIRGQALFSPLALLSVWAWLRLPRRGMLALYVAATLGMLYAHYLAALVLAAQGLDALLRRREWRRLGLAWLLCALGFAPWLPHMQAQTAVRAQVDLAQQGSWPLALHTALDSFGLDTGLDHLAGLLRGPDGTLRGEEPLRLLWAALGGVATLLGLAHLRKAPGFGLFLGLSLVPLSMFLLAIALKTPELTRPRYYVMLIPYLGMALGGALERGGWGARLAQGLLLAILAVNLAVAADYRQSSYFRAADWRTPALWAAQRSSQAQLLAAWNPQALFPLDFYYCHDQMRYDVSDLSHTRLLFGPQYRGLPQVRALSRDELQAALEGSRRVLLVLWLPDPPLREWLTRHFGVVDLLQVQNFSWDGRAELFLLERLP